MTNRSIKVVRIIHLTVIIGFIVLMIFFIKEGRYFNFVLAFLMSLSSIMWVVCGRKILGEKKSEEVTVKADSK